jgi:SAM-dependent methyltransferase
MKLENNFGHMHAEYSAARRGYPSEVYEYLSEIVNKANPQTLDIGCGTGISTRELQQYNFEVRGADKDALMVESAKKQSPEIEYIIATADKLSFVSDHFDLVTAFTAFHWFNNEESLKEIKRVLKPGGIFFAALKGNRDTEETKVFRRGYMTILKKYAGENFDSTKDHFRTNIMKGLFTDIREKSFYIDERYTVEESLTLIRSLSLWNLVSEENKPRMLDELKEFYEVNAIDGFVVRSREISTLSGMKDSHSS